MQAGRLGPRDFEVALDGGHRLRPAPGQAGLMRRFPGDLGVAEEEHLLHRLALERRLPQEECDHIEGDQPEGHDRGAAGRILVPDRDQHLGR